MGSKKKGEQMLEKTEMRMLRRIKGVTIRDKVRSHVIRKELGVSGIKEKVREARLRWYGHVMRSYKESMVRRVMEWQVTGVRRRGRPRMRWQDCVRRDMIHLGLKEEDTQARVKWRIKIQAANPAQAGRSL